jgi:hypothetical protein
MLLLLLLLLRLLWPERKNSAETQCVFARLTARRLERLIGKRVARLVGKAFLKRRRRVECQEQQNQ